MVHGAEEAEKAQSAARQLFSGVADHENCLPPSWMPHWSRTVRLACWLPWLAPSCAVPTVKPASWYSRAAFLVDGEKVTDPTFGLTVEQLQNGVVIKKGKKTYHKVMLLIV